MFNFRSACVLAAVLFPASAFAGTSIMMRLGQQFIQPKKQDGQPDWKENVGPFFALSGRYDLGLMESATVYGAGGLSLVATSQQLSGQLLAAKGQTIGDKTAPVDIKGYIDNESWGLALPVEIGGHYNITKKFATELFVGGEQGLMGSAKISARVTEPAAAADSVNQTLKIGYTQGNAAFYGARLLVHLEERATFGFEYAGFTGSQTQKFKNTALGRVEGTSIKVNYTGMGVRLMGTLNL